MPRGRFAAIRSHAPGVLAVAADSAHAFSRHTHDQFGIGVIERGAQASLSGRGRVEAGRGDVITVNPGEVHDGNPLTDGGRRWRMLYFDAALVGDAARDLEQGAGDGYQFAWPVVRDPRLTRTFGELFSALTSADDRTSLRWEGALLALLSALQDRRDAAPGGRGFPSALVRARALIDDDPAAPVTLSDLARASGLSRFQVLRAFARATGLTPHAYLVQRRIGLARRLIAAGRPLAEAALASGFADQSHMTRVFVRMYGITPRAFAAAI